MRVLLAATAALAAGVVNAQVASVDLSTYALTATWSLPTTTASEASAITWNWDSGNLFVVGDAGTAIVEVSRTGTVLGSMALSGFQDTEGLTYVGGGQFVLAEERLQRLSVFSYAAGTTLVQSTLPSITLGPNAGNQGIEGVSLDTASGLLYTVKEKQPQLVQRIDNAIFAVGGGSSSPTSVFDPAGLGVADLSDLQMLSTVVPSGPDRDNLLVFSQESAKLLKVSRTGTVLGSFSFSGIAGDAEGVTIDSNGTIYIAGEAPAIYVLTPVPEPEAWALMAAGLGLAGWLGARRRRGTRAAV